jgi:hypothetical protein
VHLEFEWDMNFERFKELLEKFEIDSTIFKLRLYHPDFFGYNYQNCAEGNYSFSTFRDMKIDYSHLLPSIEDKEGISVHIPYYALPIHLAIIKANFMQNGINSRTVVHTNEYKVDHLLTVTYESVYGKKYKQKYIVSIEISFPLVSNSGSDTPSIPTWNDFVIWISTTPI